MNFGWMQDKLKSFFSGILLLLPVFMAGQDNTACSPQSPAMLQAIRSNPAMQGYALVSACLDTLGIDTTTEGTIITFSVKTRLRVVRKKNPVLWSASDSLLMEPVRISKKKCPALNLAKPAKKSKKKDKCTCLTFDLGASGKASVDSGRRFRLPAQSRVGDTLLVSLQTVDGKPLKAAVLTDSSGQVLQADLDAAAVRYTLDIKEPNAVYHLYLRAKGLFHKRFGTIRAALHFRPDTLYWAPGNLSAAPSDLADSTTVSIQPLHFKKEQILVPTGDTLMYQPTDITLNLTGKRNPMEGRTGVISVNIPAHVEDNDLLLFVAYWIGIGSPTINAYTALEADTPPEWSQPGVSAPLAAFGMGRPIILPDISRTDPGFDPNAVPYVIADEKNKDRFLQSGNTGTTLQFFGRGRTSGNFGKGYPAGRRFYIAFINQHDINTFPIQARVVAFYQRRKPQVQLVAQP